MYQELTMSRYGLLTQHIFQWYLQIQIANRLDINTSLQLRPPNNMYPLINKKTSQRYISCKGYWLVDGIAAMTNCFLSLKGYNTEYGQGLAGRERPKRIIVVRLIATLQICKSWHKWANFIVAETKTFRLESLRQSQMTLMRRNQY